jgi:Tfp pilus assembly protein FimT
MLSLLSLRKPQAGYTVMEMMIVIGIVITGSAVAIPVTMEMVRNARGDSALTMTSTFLLSARNRAVAERRNIVLTFVSPTQMRYERVEVPSGTLTPLDTLTLEGDNQFVRLDGLPDTPDAFGGSDAINFTGGQPVMFSSDGSFIDSAGDVTNGTIFVANPIFPESARAVTIAGVTGAMRSWKWRGSQWMR